MIMGLVVKSLRSRDNYYLTGFLCFWFILTSSNSNCQILVPIKSTVSECSTGIETFEKITGIDLPQEERIPLYSSTSGAITADCYNRCRSSTSCSAFWIDYASNACFRLANPKFTDSNSVEIDAAKGSSYFERLCLQGDICSKAWVTERIPGYELGGHDDVIVRSVNSRKRCSELCLTDKRLPCRSADYWESRKECRLSREDRRTQPGSFVKSSKEVEYIENTCIEPITTKQRHCEWEMMRGFEFPIGDFATKSENLDDCQKACETYTAFTCRSVTYDTVTGLCFLSGSDMSTTSPKLLRSQENKIYAQRVPCIDMSLECNGESMTAKLKTHSPFYGKMYSSSLLPECEVFGHGKLITSLEYPLNGCGVYKDGDGAFVGNLIVQQHPLIQKRGDAAFRLICQFPETNRTLTHKIAFEKESESRLVESGSAPAPILGIATSVINATAKSPTVTLRIIDRHGNDVSGVTLGDELFFKVEVETSSAYGVFARDLVARSGTNEDELILLDTRGCPEDPAIFPYLRKTEDGSKSLKGRFEAFKFTNDAVVRFQVFLQFCRSECPAVKCDGEPSFGRRRKRDLSSLNDKNKVEYVELQKEIIVRSPMDMPSGSGMNHHYHEGGRGHKERIVCTERNLLMAMIIGFCLFQVAIVFCCAACICHKHKEKIKMRNSSKFIVEPAEPTYRPGEVYYTRPGSLISTLQSLGNVRHER